MIKKPKTMKHLIKPFEPLKSSTKLIIQLCWLAAIILLWIMSSTSDRHLFPTPIQVINGFGNLWKAGLVVHIGSSLALCAQSVLYGSIISLIFCYLSPLPILKPIATFISKLRFLPLTGISFYVSILINDARSIQVWVLVIFMATFLITSILGVINDIPEEEFDHARTQGCTRWEMLWEVVIKGRFDFMIETIRQNLAIVWMMLVSVEGILMAAGGLGTLIKNGDKMGDNGRVIAVQIIIILFGVGLDLLLRTIRKMCFRYSKF
jgi:ABC-type nitrate/sulfonate/bicarbonate transport system permease component